MAIMRNLQLFTFDDSPWITNFEGATYVKVGHNRYLERGYNVITCMVRLTGYLHGHKIVEFTAKKDTTGHCELTLFDAGYRTTTTRQAINDFMRGMGIKGSVSFAGGRFAARVFIGGDKYGENHNQKDSHVIRFRHVPYGERFAA